MEIAVNSSFSSFGREDLYKTVEEKSKQLYNSFIKNQPFLDNNERMGIFVMPLFPDLNRKIEYQKRRNRFIQLRNS